MTFSARRADNTKVYKGDGGAGAVKATKSHGSTDANLTFEAVAAGTGGNSITVALVNPGGTGDLSVGVVSNAITVTLGVSSGSIVSTANDVMAGVYNSAAARALVNVTSTGDGTGVVTALSAAALTGGTNSAEVFEQIKGLTAFRFDDRNHDSIDARTLDDPNNFITNLTEGERTASGTFQLDPADTVHAALKAAFEAGTTNNYRIEWGYGLVEQFSAQVKTFPEGDFQIGALVTGTFALLLKSAKTAV